MKKIRCNMVSTDWLKVSTFEEFAFVKIKQGDDRVSVELNAKKIRKLRKQLKRALLEIEGGSVGIEKDCDYGLCEEKKAQDEGDDWFSAGKTVKVTGNSNDHKFPIGEIVKIRSIDSEGDAKAEYLDGHDWWWIKKSDCEPA